VAAIEDKLVENYEKNQWNTLILTSLAQQQFDLESYVKMQPFFPKPEERNHHGFSSNNVSKMQFHQTLSQKGSEVMINTKFSAHLKPEKSIPHSEAHSSKSDCEHIRLVD
jgi:hypothetical protein